MPKRALGYRPGTGEPTNKQAEVHHTGDPVVAIGDRLQQVGAPTETGHRVRAPRVGERGVGDDSEDDPRRPGLSERDHPGSVSHRLRCGAGRIPSDFVGARR